MMRRIHEGKTNNTAATNNNTDKNVEAIESGEK